MQIHSSIWFPDFTAILSYHVNDSWSSPVHLVFMTFSQSLEISKNIHTTRNCKISLKKYKMVSFQWFLAFCLCGAPSILLVSCQYYEEETVSGTGNGLVGGGIGGTGSRQEYIDSSEDTDDPATSAPAAATLAPTAAPITSTINPVHVQGQVNNILSSVESFNISGIVDQALGIRNNTPVRNLVNGIISTVFCNPFFIRINTNGCGGQRYRAVTTNLPVYDYVVYRLPRSSASNKNQWE